MTAGRVVALPWGFGGGVAGRVSLRGLDTFQRGCAGIDEAWEVMAAADRIITDTISFLTVCATNAHQRFRPSKQVDLGWHQFILNTTDYAEFCDRVAGRFIHHVPDEFVAPERRATAGVLGPTVEAIKAAGLPLHPELWLTGEGRCSQCHAGCTNCGQGGDEDPS